MSSRLHRPTWDCPILSPHNSHFTIEKQRENVPDFDNRGIYLFWWNVQFSQQKMWMEKCLSKHANAPYTLHANFITYRFLKVQWQGEQWLADRSERSGRVEILDRHTPAFSSFTINWIWRKFPQNSSFVISPCTLDTSWFRAVSNVRPDPKNIEFWGEIFVKFNCELWNVNHAETR